MSGYPRIRSHDIQHHRRVARPCPCGRWGTIEPTPPPLYRADCGTLGGRHHTDRRGVLGSVDRPGNFNRAPKHGNCAPTTKGGQYCRRRHGRKLILCAVLVREYSPLFDCAVAGQMLRSLRIPSIDAQQTTQPHFMERHRLQHGLGLHLDPDDRCGLRTEHSLESPRITMFRLGRCRRNYAAQCAEAYMGYSLRAGRSSQQWTLSLSSSFSPCPSIWSLACRCLQNERR